MTPHRRGVVALAAALYSGSAWAAPTPEEVAVAQQHFNAAREQQAHRDWVGCENSVKQAIQISETPGLRFHLAFCKEQQHRWVEALVDYRRAGELVAQGAKAEDVAELLPGATEELERQTPQLRLLLEEVPEGAQLYVDDKAISAELLGVAFPVNPGTRRVRITAPGYTAYLQEVNLVPQDRRTLRVQLVELSELPGSAAEPSRRPVPKAEPSAMSGLGLTLAGEAILALGGLGVGVGFSLAASKSGQAANDAGQTIGNTELCDRPHPDGTACSKLEQSREDQARYTLISTIGYVGAGTATVGFLVTWLVWPTERPPLQAVVLDNSKGALLRYSTTF